MVVETYTNGPEPVYRRAAERGRMLPPGLRYVESWVVDDDALDRCFQLMETDDPALFDVWTAAWSDLARIGILPSDRLDAGSGPRRGRLGRGPLTSTVRNARA
jgi:uncharacterized protein DUF3303